MKKLEDKLEDKIDKLTQEVLEIKTTMLVNTHSLQVHMSRTDAAEELISLYKKEMDNFQVKTEGNIQLFKRHVSFVKGACWSLGIISIIILGLNQLGILTKLFS